MKRFYVVAVAAALAGFVGINSWSHGSQGGGGGASGGAGGAGGAGAAGATGSAGAGAAGATGTAGAAGAAGNVGNRAAAGAPANRNGAAGTVGGNAQMNANFNGINPTPFFANPTVRSQLQLNNRQFNQLNTAYQQALQRYNRGLGALRTGTAAAQRSNRQAAARANAAAADSARVTRPGATQSEQERLAALQRLRNQFNSDFSSSLDATFTDPAMRARFNQLNLQFQGIDAFNDPTIQQQLNLTAQQRQQLAALNGEWRRALRNMQRGSRNNLTQQQFDALRMQFANRLNGVFTPQQQQLWAQLTGQPFDFPFTAFFPPATTPTDQPLVPKSRAAQTPQTPQTPTVR